MRKRLSLKFKPLVGLLLLFSPFYSFAQLNGVNYTIDKGAKASSTNYTSFQDLADDLAKNGVSGKVVVTVVKGSGPYNEWVEFDDVPKASATNQSLSMVMVR